MTSTILKCMKLGRIGRLQVKKIISIVAELNTLQGI